MMSRSVMKVLHSMVTLMACLLMVVSVEGRVVSGMTDHQPFPIPGLVTVQLEDNIEPIIPNGAFKQTSLGAPSLDAILRGHVLEEARMIFPWRTERPPINSGLHDLSRFYELRFAPGTDISAVIEQLLNDPNVRHAEPVWAIPLEDVFPDDPNAVSQWYLNNMDLYSAWELETGSDSIKVAIIDTGVNYDHPDLIDNVWVNPGEDLDGDMVVYDTDDLNGVDDDGNGIVDDLVGYDFFSGFGAVYPGEDGGVPDPNPHDFDGHGSHCAGIAAAATNNGVGVTGLAGGWYGGVAAQSRGCRIVCLRAGATASDGLGYVGANNCASAMDYATLIGANVINCSWGGSSAQSAALANALAAGITVVHAAGNANADDPDYLDVAYGGACLSVAATRSDDRKAWFSNYGAWVDVSAPGQTIYSTVSDRYGSLYQFFDGTSMSAPVVTGLAALIKSMMPSLTREEVENIIINTADDIDGINPSYVGLLGSGRVNAFNALSSLANAKFTADVIQGETPLTVDFTDLSPNSPSSWKWRFGDEDSSEVQHPTHVYDTPGIHTVSLVIEDPNGIGEERLKNYIWVQADTMRIDSVLGFAGEEVTVPVYLTNTAVIKEIKLSLTMENEDGFTLNDVSLDGTRMEGSFKVLMTGYGGLRREYTIKPATTGSTAYLPAGSGPIVNLVVGIPIGAGAGTSVEIDSLTWISGTPNISTVWYDYWPEFYTGKVVVDDCCGQFTGGLTGNTNCSSDGLTTLSDITRLIDHVFVSRDALCCEGTGNTNGDIEGLISLSDITRLIDYVYVAKTPTEPCQ